MHATVRRYSGSPDLVDGLVSRRDDVLELIRGIDGFRAYYLIRTGDGEALSITVYDTREGTEESNRQAADFVANELPDVKAERPEITEGDVVIDA